ncbi:MAG: hypothetical protein M1824_005206 [Vezdaea acicularis]|nr:MAG: hypothetical protein M1824_005206 [Vezdaea acicularis]
MISFLFYTGLIANIARIVVGMDVATAENGDGGKGPDWIFICPGPKYDGYIVGKDLQEPGAVTLDPPWNDPYELCTSRDWDCRCTQDGEVLCADNISQKEGNEQLEAGLIAHIPTVTYSQLYCEMNCRCEDYEGKRKRRLRTWMATSRTEFIDIIRRFKFRRTGSWSNMDIMDTIPEYGTSGSSSDTRWTGRSSCASIDGQSCAATSRRKMGPYGHGLGMTSFGSGWKKRDVRNR